MLMAEQKDCTVYFLDEARDKIKQAKKDLSGGKDYDLIFNMVNCLIKGGMPPDTIQGYLQNISVICDPMIMTQDTYDNIDKAIKLCVENKKEISLAQEIKDLISCHHGVIISSSFVDKELCLSSRVIKQNRSNIMNRLVEDGMLERHGKRGEFRVVDKTLNKINWRKPRGDEFDINLPIGLNRLVSIYPKNIIILAGMSNAGKTALLMNVVGYNLDQYKNRIHYFSSEMSEEELGIRLRSFGLNDEAWAGCNFYHRTKDFQDVIFPDDINIIDFFEKYDTFYDIGKDLSTIWEKLNKGIAIVALQKSKGKEEGRGGDFSKEKARLYITLDQDETWIKAKITKAKAWKTKINPNGLVKNIQIADGYQILEFGDWHREAK